jgi:glycosyltransferase involved in cell wall biosynthesis
VPRKCGIATFTADLAGALSDLDPTLDIDSIAVSDSDEYVYPERVCCEIAEGDRLSYGLAADYINRYGYDLLSIQHEYGIFGGEAGSYLMNLVRQANMPIVTTLHTVLREPSPEQRLVMDELLQFSERVVVMSQKAVGFLKDVHGVPHDKIDLIPHGIPNIPISAGQELRKELNITGPMILTFGLLSPDKGIQYVIEAMPKIVREHPGATYIVVGATHPNVRASAGEVYREGLAGLAKDLGVESNVRFLDRFVTSEELVQYLAAMDIYVTPYLNPHQITSGTLAYSIGAGKAVISTPYWYAEELLADGRGVLVPFRDSEAIADAVLSIQRSPEVRQQMGRKAAEYGRKMLWPDVAKRYLATFARAKFDSAARLRELVQVPLTADHSVDVMPELKLDHLFDLSDDTGILQHASFTVPVRAEGYCVDDNARALLLTALLDQEAPLPRDVALLQSRYLGFVTDAYNPATGRFRNFLSYRREWLEESGSEDSQGRSLWALGAIANRCRDRNRREVAKALFELAVPEILETTSPRTWAYGVLAADEYLVSFPHQSAVHAFKETLAGRILRLFETNQGEDWPWCEQSLSYANARIPQALIVAGEGSVSHAMVEKGLESLTWLMGVQTAADGVFAPIGTNGFLVRDGERAEFDQQPVEAAASVSACLSAHRVTGSLLWIEEARRAFRWFLGDNQLGQPLYDRTTGGCHDGLHSKRVNGNQGAESTLSYLCAFVEMRGAVARRATIARGKQDHEE